MLATTQIKLVWVPVGQTFLRAGFGRLPDSSPPLVLTHFPPFPGEDTGSVRRMEGPVTTHLARSPLVLLSGLEEDDHKPTQPTALPGLRPPPRWRHRARAQGTRPRIGFLAFEAWKERNTGSLTGSERFHSGSETEESAYS